MTGGAPIIGAVPLTTVVVAEALAGVRHALAAVVTSTPGLDVTALAATVAEALTSPGAVVVSGLLFPDGTAEALCGLGRPVVVVTTLPADEREEVNLSGAAAVVRYGDLRRDLAEVVRRAVPAR